MKKVTVFAILLAVLSIKAQDYRKYWKDGKLTWDDFQAKPTKNTVSNLAYVLLYKTDKKVINNTNYRGVFADAYVDKSLSFVHNNLKDEYQLKYNQVLFNLLEIYRRIFQQRIYRLNNFFEINSLLDDIRKQLNRKILDFQEASNFGIDKEVTESWLLQTTQQLANDVETIPDFGTSNWSYGLFAGLEFVTYSENYNDFFNDNLAFALAFEFSYKKIFMGLGMSLTTSKLNKDLESEPLILPKGTRSSIGILNAYFGYPIYETQKFRVLPFAGYGFSFIGETGTSENREEINTGTSVFGVNFDFKNRKSVNFMSNGFGINEAGFSYIRARIFMSNSSFNPNLKGYFLNIGLSFGIEGRFLSKK